MKKLLTLLAILATFALHAQIKLPLGKGYYVTGKVISQTDSAFYTWDTIGQVRPGWVHLKIHTVFSKLDVWAIDGTIFFKHSIEYKFSEQLDSLWKFYKKNADSLDCRQPNDLFISTFNALQGYRLLSQKMDSLQKRIELLEQRGYTYLDLESPRPGLWTKEASGQYDIRLLPLNDSTVKSLLSKGWFYKN